MNKDRKIGKSFPLGATVCPDGVNFSVFAKGGEAVQLLLFDQVCLCGLQVSFYAQNAAKLSPKVMAAMNAALAELKDDDPPLMRLKKERFNAALKEAKAWSNLFDRGLTGLPELIDVGQRLFAAEVDLYD